MTAVSEQTGAFSEQTTAWLADFTEQPAAEPWLQQLREAAFQRFAELGFPTTHDEEWRFTSVAPIARTSFHVVAANPLLHVPSGVQELNPSDAKVDLAHHAADRNAFVALNTAFLNK